MKKLLLPILLLFTIAGCKTRKTPFSWEGYSESLYNVKENPSEESVKQHKEVLRSIIDRSNEDEELQVPPGVYAELGYYLMKGNKMDEGKKYLQKEKELYPESRPFVREVIDRAEN